jgi:hypothetical protein
VRSKSVGPVWQESCSPAGAACLSFSVTPSGATCEFAGICDSDEADVVRYLQELNTPVIRGAIDVAGN